MKIVSMACATLLLAACSQNPQPQSDNGNTATPATAQTTHINTPFDPLLQDRDKAKAVEKTLMDADQQRRKRIDEAGG